MVIDKSASESMSQIDAEEPPPYSPGSHRAASVSRRNNILPPLPVEGPEASLEPDNTFSQIDLDTRFHDLKGTYRIDPKNPTTHLKNKKTRVKRVPDAAFRTRSGKVALSLTTTGLARDVAKASVVVTSKSGNITLNLLPADESRPRFDLEVKSNSGTVVIFIPPTYSGAIQLHTKSGSLGYLPALSARLQVVKSADTESLVLFGQQAAPLASDFCHVRTRSGNVLIGLRGEDKYVEEPGLWQRIGGFLKGDVRREDHSSP
ncbi:hypothetical protein GGX14DRAFT_648994 [Mycena pura]|uniref:DUF7330 domain-containing protein n=1 Tax=Mycena pura TaxID=153505 RepID=A0AAD6YMU3_9AGAR|nr:hypothetical protein GGX14DRAFT_648994 [Mycena pura]